MRLPRWKAIASFFLAAVLSAPAWADTTSASSALPGTLNYVEGQATIGTQALNSKSIGSAELQPGQSLTTEQGKAEVLLTPGVFLRIGANSSVTMISPSITNTEVGLDRGHAMIEIAEIHPENDIRMRENGATVRMLKTGLYDFDSQQEQLRIFDGKALVKEGTQQISVKDGREVNLAGNATLKAQKFDKKSYEDGDLYRWSSLRSAYLAEANVDAAGAYAMNGWGPWGPGWWGTGWYWDPWFDTFTFLPGDGLFFSPFGWGFYSPWWVYRCPLYGYGYLHRYGYGYYDHYVHHFSANVRNWGPGPHYVDTSNYVRGIYHGPGASSGRGFRSGPRMASSAHGFGAFRGGGFHGGGGGFHGGGGGGHGGGGGGGHGR